MSRHRVDRWDTHPVVFGIVGLESLFRPCLAPRRQTVLRAGIGLALWKIVKTHHDTIFETTAG